MSRLAFTISFCAALLLEGCANGGNPLDSLYRTASGANPFSSGPAPAQEGALYLGVVEGLMMQGRESAALAFLDGYGQSGENLSPRYWLLGGNALLALGRNGDSANAFSRLQNTPLAAYGWNGLGRIAAADRNWELAEQDFHNAVGAGPANANFLNNLAFADLNLHNADSAITRLQQAYELDPGSDRIRTNLIVALTLKGDSTRAGLIAAGIKDSAHREAVQTLVKDAITTFSMERKS